MLSSHEEQVACMRRLGGVVFGEARPCASAPTSHFKFGSVIANHTNNSPSLYARTNDTMANREKGGRVVFIGNIPYGVSEEQIMDIFGRCGQVMGFRLVYDKETGQPKGFGFLEYSDTDSAASAVRNLNEFELNGRTLRVDYSNDNRSTANANNQQQDSNRAPPPAHFNIGGAASARPDPSALPPMPPGVELPPGVTAFDQISSTLGKLDTPQLLDFISQLKNLCASNPAQATALLQSQPQLGYAVFQAMLLLNLVDTSIVTQLVATAGPQQPVQQPPPPQQQPQPMQYAPPQPPQPQYGQYPPGYGQPYAPTPPQQPAYQPPPPQQAAPPPDQAALIRQVMALSPEQIMAIQDPHARDQLLTLRRQYGGV